MWIKLAFLFTSFLVFGVAVSLGGGLTLPTVWLSLAAWLLIQFSFYAWSFFDFYRPWRPSEFLVPVFLDALAFSLVWATFRETGYVTGYPAVFFAFSALAGDAFLRITFRWVVPLVRVKTVVFLAESSWAVEIARDLAEHPSEWKLTAFLTRNSHHFPPVPHQIFWCDWSEVCTLVPSLSPSLLIWEDPLPLEEFSYLALPEEILDLAPSLSLVEFVVHEQQKVPVEQVNQAWIDRFLRPISPWKMCFKRALDVILALGLLFPLSALMGVTALITRLASTGPVLYSQRREGLGGVPFTLYKFRSMSVNAEAEGAQWASARDSRVTPWGRVMRKLRLDELPQVWNVLRGDMSFVGPRPERPEFTSTLAHEIPFYSLRNRVKPGLTGWAQVNYPYGASVQDALRKLEYDLYYVHNPSLFQDLKILIKTAQVVIMRQGQ